MENFKLNSGKVKAALPIYMVLLSFFVICCDNNEIKSNSEFFYPPKADVESTFETFYPDSGGLGTKLIIKGSNFGTDTNYVRVTVNQLKAKVVRVNDNILYAVVPARADTGYVRLYIRKGEEEVEYTSDREFKYMFKSNVSTLIGTPGKQAADERLDGAYTVALLRRPWQIITDKDGTIYWSDEGRGQSKNGALRKASNGEVETLVYNSSGPYQSCNGFAFNSTQDTLFMANRWNSGDVRNDVSVMYSTREANFVNVKALINFPKSGTASVAIHPKTGELFFDHNDEGAVYKYNKNAPNGYEKMFNVRGSYNAMDMRLLFNKEGDILYLVLRGKHCIYKVSYDAATHTFGTPEPFAGEWSTSGYENGEGLAARFNSPSSPCLDPEGNLLIPDKFNHCIRKITPKGTVSLYAGKPRESGHADGLPDKAKFFEPEALTFHRNTLYVADRGNHCIRKVVIE
ncbi:IPT/TIG domain-containing protein [Bacteroides bouchesdurhonensis]|uniref:IPT/TIG domain-containing protein n=1 Tax=Bacteroides bouchesdurhonensis TaxID=1841855 RepID=UPI0011DE1126|nr:IPT/TIG domain-containing protein [Bacteroides bouchesdurhonensis]